MKSPALILFLLTVLLLPSVSSGAQDIHVLVGDITDKRSTGHFSDCEIELKLMGDAVPDFLGIRAIRVLSATDDTGRNLVREKGKSSASFSANTERQPILKQTVKLRNPSRNAKVIRLLSGQLELFRPTVENGGMIIARNFMTRPSEPIVAPGLRKWKVEMMYLTKESLEAKKKALEAEEKKTPENVGEKFGQAFVELFKGMFGRGFFDDKNSLSFFVSDPDERLVDLTFLDAAGNPIKTWGRSSSGKFRSYSFEKALPRQDTQLVVYLATPSALKLVSFKLDNIPLP